MFGKEYLTMRHAVILAPLSPLAYDVNTSAHDEFFSGSYDVLTVPLNKWRIQRRFNRTPLANGSE